MFAAFTAVLPVFLVIAVGIFLRAKEYLPSNTGAILGIIVLRVALPALLLHLLANAKASDLSNAGLWTTAFVVQFITCILAIIADLIFFRRGIQAALISSLCSSTSNAAFVGLPIILNIYPDNPTAPAIAGLVILSSNICFLFVQGYFDSSKKNEQKAQSKFIQFFKTIKLIILANPVMLAMIIGVILSLSGIGLWQPLDRVASLIGVIAAPAMLLAVGFDLQEKLSILQKKKSTFIFAGYLTILRLGLAPLIAWGLMSYLDFEAIWIVIFVIIYGTGSALVSSVVATVYKVIPEDATFCVLLTNGLSMFSLTVIIWLFKIFAYI